VAYLVSRGSKIDIEDNNQDNCLHWAVYKGHPDLTRLLIIYGMNPKKIDKFGQSILHLACLSGNLNIVQHLIEQVAKTKYVNANEYTDL
jgi:ankyrin repeat protein